MLKRLLISYQHQVTSTSDLAKEAVRQNKPAGTAFRAGLQTKGRGRHGRSWVSPEGNLYVSVILYPKAPETRWPELSLVTSVALFDAIHLLRPDEDISLKWPNDILVNGRKCAGILLEREGNAIIIGCGVNLDAAPSETEGWAPGSLNRDMSASPISDEMLMERFEKTLISRYNAWEESGFEQHRLDWMAAAAHIGATLVVDLGQGRTVSGIFESLGNGGALMLRSMDDTIHEIQAGDVISARLEGE